MKLSKNIHEILRLFTLITYLLPCLKLVNLMNQPLKQFTTASTRFLCKIFFPDSLFVFINNASSKEERITIVLLKMGNWILAAFSYFIINTFLKI